MTSKNISNDVYESLISYEKLNVDEWEYKCEGNVNVILSYTGHDYNMIGKVLRLRKCAEFEDSSELFTHLYIKHIIRSFMGNQLVDPGTLVKVDKDFIASIQKKIEPFRPLYRLQNVGRNLVMDSAVAILMDDMTHLPKKSNGKNRHVYSVEIKPKSGILCRSGYVNDQSIKKHTCRYCMHQHFKLGKGDITRPSQFCPLDLFAPHDPDRVRRALDSLIDDPQNNMRLYIDSDLVWFGHMRQPQNEETPNYRDRLNHILESKRFSKDGCNQTAEFVTMIQNCLKQSGVLRRIRRMQLFDKMDVEAVHKIFEHLTQQESVEQLHKTLFDFEGLSAANSDDPEDKNWLAQLEEEFAKLPQDVDYYCRNKYAQVFDANVQESLSKQAVEEIVFQCMHDDKLARHAIRMFLLAQCAKDCSIMICFERSEDDEQDLHFKVGVVDMDPKPVSKIPHYLEMDNAIMSTFMSSAKK